MEHLDSLKLDALKAWRTFSWVVTICYGLFAVVGFSLDGTTELVEWIFVLSPFAALLMQTISVTLVYQLLDNREKH